jgi:hypothetical protein
VGALKASPSPWAFCGHPLSYTMAKYLKTPWTASAFCFQDYPTPSTSILIRGLFLKMASCHSSLRYGEGKVALSAAGLSLGEVTVLSNPYTEVRVCRRCCFCSTVRCTRLLRRVAGLYWGGVFGFSSPQESWVRAANCFLIYSSAFLFHCIFSAIMYFFCGYQSSSYLLLFYR